MHGSNARAAGVNWAGADETDQRIWNGEWQLSFRGDEHLLQAAEGEFAIDLVLTPLKPPIAHGEKGLSRKGPTPGNASYDYSLTRMTTSGGLWSAASRLMLKA